jgi:hypothetical protein
MERDFTEFNYQEDADNKAWAYFLEKQYESKTALANK